MNKLLTILLTMALLLICFRGIAQPGQAASADSTDGPSSINAPRRADAARVSNGAITVDGKLDEEVWKRAGYVTGFTQRSPNEGAPATETTEIAFYYDDKALYIGARMFSDDPQSIQAQVNRRDETGNSQRLIIALDTYLDRRTAHSFAVTASGVRAEYFQPEDEMNYRSRDYTFDPVWTAEAQIDSLGWTAEMRIPFSQLRFNKKPEQVWGLNVNRFIPKKNEDSFWVHLSRDQTGFASRFGVLTGIKDVTPSRRLELLPYLAGNSLLTNPDPGNPFLDDVNLEGRVGGNIEYGLGPNLTLNATINPDFGQVEIDPAQVNLSAFETIFDEKRPFFTEGQQVFDVLGSRRESYFFSRRIGASPSLSPDADFVEEISNTSILGATKITGRLPSGLSIGGVTAVTANEKARTYNEDTDQFDKVAVEPLTSFNAVRMEQEFGPYGSTAGFIMTGVYRDLNQGTELASILNKTAITGAGDWKLRFQEGKYEVTGDAGFSYISGSTDAILGTQTSSTHYLQRPDASHVSIDSTATSLSGYRASLGIAKKSGRHWLWELDGSAKSPGFELNDAGILFQADEISNRAELTYRENDPGSFYQNYRISFDSRIEWNYGWTRKDTEFSLRGDLEWKNFWGTDINLEYSPRTMSDRLTRGGPLMGNPSRSQLRLGFSTDRNASVFARVFGSYSGDELGGYRFSINSGIRIRPGGNIEYSIDPRYSIQTNKQQYLDTRAGGPAETFGNRYIFATIDRTTISTRIRVNYAFNPDLTLELFAEPFVSSGSFRNPGQLAKPEDLELERFEVEGKSTDGDFIIRDGTNRFEVEDPDFLIKSFRSNLVLRYQWRPGSTFFLVWQADLSAREDLARFARPGDLTDTFTASGNNIFALKFTYWLPVSN